MEQLPRLVIIPTYNEARNITLVLDRVMSLPHEWNVLVVDDGSPDGTADLVDEAAGRHAGRIHCIRRAGKLGLGTAYVAGFRFALQNGFDLIAEMDADLSHDPDDLPTLAGPIERGEADLVIGSRYIEGVRVMNWPLSRLILSYGAGIYTRMITRLPIQDVTAGFKCYHRRVLDSINLERVRSNGYSFQIEMKYRAYREGYRLLEVPIVFTERTEGESKMSSAIVREAAWKVWALRLAGLVGRL